jgi:hypothetical protein
MHKASCYREEKIMDFSLRTKVSRFHLMGRIAQPQKFR